MTSILVSSQAEVFDNIARYQAAARKSRQLRERAGYVQSWYAIKDSSGEWRFAPSKFIGYRGATAEKYLSDTRSEGALDGRQTERVLSEWFKAAERGTRLERELSDALRRFLAELDQAPNARARINVPAAEVEGPTGVTQISDELLARVTSDPRICGGRPCIKGTRMRVSDIVEALAQGATREELLHDFDYLTAEDLAAALLYAARATDHRIVRIA